MSASILFQIVDWPVFPTAVEGTMRLFRGDLATRVRFAPTETPLAWDAVDRFRCLVALIALSAPPPTAAPCGWRRPGGWSRR